MKTNEWNDAAAALPDDQALVLIALNDDDVWTGYRDAGIWRYVDSMPIVSERVTHWMRMPAPPPKIITTSPPCALFHPSTRLVNE